MERPTPRFSRTPPDLPYAGTGLGHNYRMHVLAAVVAASRMDRLDELIAQNPRYCHKAVPRYVFFAERPLFAVTLVHGERRETLPVDLLYAGAARDRDWKKDRYCDCEALFDRAYFVPLGDASWPDDARVELEYMPQEHFPITKQDFHAALGEATVLDFPSGYEVWVYPALALAFDPSGALAKTRLR